MIRPFLEYGAYLMQNRVGAALHGSLLVGDYDMATFLADKGARIKEGTGGGKSLYRRSWTKPWWIMNDKQYSIKDKLCFYKL